LDAEADALADHLTLLPYDNIILVGHSLGGIFARLTLKQLLESRDTKTLTRVVSVILMASPTLGARWISAAFGWLTHDFRALARDGTIVQAVEQLYNADLSPQFNRKLHTASSVPLWAITAAADSWVTRLSARAQVPDLQRRSVIGSHTEIVKPASRAEPAYGLFLEMMRMIVEQCEPAIVDRVTMKGFEVRPATAADAASVFDCARREFPGHEVSPIDAIEIWLEWDPYCIWLVKKLGGPVGGAIQGYWCAFSLAESALKAIKAGRLTGPQLRHEHFSDGDDDLAGIYVGAIVGNSKITQGLVMKHAQKELDRRTSGRIIEIVARAVTSNGLDLLKTLGFVGIDGDQLGNVFSGTSSARAKGRRRRR
jgi:pimeloyl-ACP methyl ester carboxylesterase